MLLKRSFKKEIIDDLSITDSRLNRALDELKTINLFLGGNSVSRAGIKAVMKNYSAEKIRILDVGSGGSDLFFNTLISGKTPDPVSADMNLQACRYTKLKHPEAKVVCCDAMRLPFKNKSFDVIHSSLFFHHFKEDDIVKILKQSLFVARGGIVVNDLRRSVLALAGIKILTVLFSKSPMVRNDAPLSVKRGFIKGELKAVLSEVKGCTFAIRRKWAFRWLIYCRKK